MKSVKVDVMGRINNRPSWAAGGEGDKSNWFAAELATFLQTGKETEEE